MCDLPSSSKSKIGRKGDPRMHQAVVAKMKDPNMSLLDALVAGGFEFPEVDKNDKSSKYSLKDKDGVLLGQRKNQLSRRLRDAKNQTGLEKQEDGSTTSSVNLDVKDKSSQSSALTAKRKTEGETSSESDKPSFTNLSSYTSLNQSSKFADLPALSAAATLISNKHPNVPTLQQQQGKQNDTQSTGSSGSIFSGKLKDFDSFSFLTTLKSDAISLLSHSVTNDTKSENETKTTDVLQNATSIVPLTAMSNGLNKQDLTSSNNLNPLLSDTLIKTLNCFKNDHLATEPKTSIDENDICLHPRNAENKPFLKEAITLFEADIHNYIQNTMKKAGYPHSDTSEQSSEYLTFFANAINAQIDRIQSLRNKNSVSCSHTESVKNGSNSGRSALLKSAVGCNNLQANMNHIENSTSNFASQRNQPINSLLSNMSSQSPLSKKSRLDYNSNTSYMKEVLDECQGAPDGESDDTD